MLRNTQEAFHWLSRLLASTAIACGSLAALPRTASAQSYPVHPVHLVVPYAAGGGVDTIARIIGEPLAGLLGQPVIVDDKPGAGANIGTAFVAKAPADGYTLLLGSFGLATNGALFADPGFDTVRDFAPVQRIGYAPVVFVVPASSPEHSLADLIRDARTKPGTLTYGSAGNGSSAHLAGELLRSMAGIDVVHVPYKGGAPAMTDLLGGRISFMPNNPLEVLPHIHAGRVRALAVGSAARLALLPGVPTVAEQGLTGYEATVWWGVVAPVRTPEAVLHRLADATATVLAQPGVKEKLSDAGVVVDPQAPAAFGAFLRAEITKWTRVIKSSGIHAD